MGPYLRTPFLAVHILFFCGTWVFGESLRRDRLQHTSAAPTRNACYITQVGFDGFGHQYEGKLSCILLSMINPQTFRYLHTPFTMFQHTSIDPSEVNTFTNLENGSYQMVADARTLHGRAFEQSKAMASHALGSWLEDYVYSNKQECSPDTIYSLDNCFGTVYDEPYVSHIDSKKMSELRRVYDATPKPSTGFHNVRPNVVIHVRRGDAGSRTQESSYYDRAIAFYNDTLVQPLFWIESNDPSWAYLKQLKAKWPEDFMEPNKSTEPLAAFHRMVMADGFVMSMSSLSYAAALLRLSKLKMVIPKMALNESPKLFFETPLFLVI